MSTQRNVGWNLGLAVGLVGLMACGGDDAGTRDMPDDPAPAVIESRAPLCTDISNSDDPTALFSHPVVDPVAVSAALVFGDMEPQAPQEVLNFELGFYLPKSAPLSAPTDLYIEAIERSYHQGTGITDWGLTYHVCSYQDGSARRAAVFGNFAHMTTLSPELAALFDAEKAKLDDGLPSAVVCDDQETSCGLNMNILRDLQGDPELVVVAEAGSAIGTGGSNDEVGPAGIDANLIDRRVNDYQGHFYLNPDRLGAEDGPGLAWRYAACTYEYFPEPYRSAYLSKISILGESRVSAEHPCGTLEVDAGAAGTVGGLWAMSAMAGESMGTDFGGAELDAYLSNLLVLGDHLTAPDTRMMLSTPIEALSKVVYEPSVIEFDKSTVESANWAKLVNIPFKATEPGQLYCYAGVRQGGFEEVYYLAEISEDGSTMTLQRVFDDCTDTPPEARSFDEQADEYFVFVR